MLTFLALGLIIQARKPVLLVTDVAPTREQQALTSGSDAELTPASLEKLKLTKLDCEHSVLAVTDGVLNPPSCVLARYFVRHGLAPVKLSDPSVPAAVRNALKRSAIQYGIPAAETEKPEFAMGVQLDIRMRFTLGSKSFSLPIAQSPEQRPPAISLSGQQMAAANPPGKPLPAVWDERFCTLPDTVSALQRTLLLKECIAEIEKQLRARWGSLEAEVALWMKGWLTKLAPELDAAHMYDKQSVSELPAEWRTKLSQWLAANGVQRGLMREGDPLDAVLSSLSTGGIAMHLFGSVSFSGGPWKGVSFPLVGSHDILP